MGNQASRDDSDDDSLWSEDSLSMPIQAYRGSFSSLSPRIPHGSKQLLLVGRPHSGRSTLFRQLDRQFSERVDSPFERSHYANLIQREIVLGMIGIISFCEREYLERMEADKRLAAAITVASDLGSDGDSLDREELTKRVSTLLNSSSAAASSSKKPSPLLDAESEEGSKSSTMEKSSDDSCEEDSLPPAETELDELKDEHTEVIWGAETAKSVRFIMQFAPESKKSSDRVLSNLRESSIDEITNLLKAMRTVWKHSQTRAAVFLYRCYINPAISEHYHRYFDEDDYLDRIFSVGKYDPNSDDQKEEGELMVEESSIPSVEEGQESVRPPTTPDMSETDRSSVFSRSLEKDGSISGERPPISIRSDGKPLSSALSSRIGLSSKRPAIRKQCFEPSDEDINRASLGQSGVSTMKINVNSSPFYLTLVRSKPSRESELKMLKDLDNLSALMFVCPLSGFDEYSHHWRPKQSSAAKMNVIQESLMMWESLIKKSNFKGVTSVVFLNKRDVFEQKLRDGKCLSQFFDDYKGRKSHVEDSVEFVESEFRKRDKRDSGITLLLSLVATDSEDVRRMMNVFGDLINPLNFGAELLF